MLDGGYRSYRRVLHVLVVLADEDHRQFPDDSRVERLWEGADVGGPVPEETYRDLSGLANLCRPGSPCRDRQMGSDDRIGAHRAMLDIRQVHRSALAMEHAVAATKQFGHGGRHRRAASEGVAMAAIGTEGVVIGSHRHGVARGDRLLTQRDVAGAAYQVLEGRLASALLEIAQLDHQLIESQPRRAVDLSGLGLLYLGAQ